MAKLDVIVYNSFFQNTIVVHDETKKAVLIDPGVNSPEEKENLKNYLTGKNLVLSKVLFTHCHLDHIFGARFISQTYPEIKFYAHKEETFFLSGGAQVMASMFSVKLEDPPGLDGFINDGEVVRFGETELEALWVPGHSPGSLCYVCHKDKFVIAGDVLFAGSVGRADLPGGDLDTLLSGIEEKLFSLPEDYILYPGHGNSTTIGREKMTNPYFR